MRLYRKAFLVPRCQEQITEADAIKSLTAFFLGKQAHSDWPECLTGTPLGDHWNGLGTHAQAAWRKDMELPWIIVADGMEGCITGKRAYKLNKLFWLVHRARLAVRLIVGCETKWRKELPVVVRPRRSWVEVCLEATPAG